MWFHKCDLCGRTRVLHDLYIQLDKDGKAKKTCRNQNDCRKARREKK